MGKMLFGSEETITCIEKVALKGAEEESLCLAHMHTKVFFVAGLYVKDNGYVLQIDGQQSYYPIPEGEELTNFQEAGMLPKVFPDYSIGFVEYAFGYSLWIVLLFVGAFTLWKSKRESAQLESDSATPIGHGPPALNTEADRFIYQQVKPLLARRETIEHQAYATNGEPSAFSKAFFVVLTNQRLFFIKTRVGAFKLLLENNELVSFPLEQLAFVNRTANETIVAFQDGTTRTIYVAPSKKLSNQDAFRRDVPRILQGHLDAQNSSASSTGDAAAELV